jgi:hypothetical protein
MPKPTESTTPGPVETSALRLSTKLYTIAELKEMNAEDYELVFQSLVFDLNAFSNNAINIIDAYKFRNFPIDCQRLIRVQDVLSSLDRALSNLEKAVSVLRDIIQRLIKTFKCDEEL